MRVEKNGGTAMWKVRCRYYGCARQTEKRKGTAFIEYESKESKIWKTTYTHDVDERNEYVV